MLENREFWLVLVSRIVTPKQEIVRYLTNSTKKRFVVSFAIHLLVWKIKTLSATASEMIKKKNGKLNVSFAREMSTTIP